MPVLLHTHSWYSLLEGVDSPESLLQAASKGGYSALALTDTNNLYGAISFWQLAHKQGIRPLLGVCLRHNSFLGIALIAEPAGYRNICRILSRWHLAQGSVSMLELLRQNAEGLHLLVPNTSSAESLREAFGKRLWLEVVRPWYGANDTNYPTPRERRELAAAKELGIRAIASAPVWFVEPQKFHDHRVLSAARHGTMLDALPKQSAVTPKYHLLSVSQFRERFRDMPYAVRNTEVLAEQLRSDVLPRQTVMPPCRLPRQLNANQYLGVLCERGLRRRDMGEDLGARRRLREELTIIHSGDLATYFLVVRSLTLYARRRGYSMALRGSAGSSLVCYLLEITDIDPLRFGLSLDRFLHPGRADLPDIDLDFDWKVRDEVIAHTIRRHGPEYTAMISSHLFFQPRSAFREAAKIHGLSNEQISDLAQTLDERVERIVVPHPIRNPFSSEHPPRSFPLEPERWPRLVRDARVLLGHPHHLSIHPGGIIITPNPIEEYAPLQRAPKGITITQFEKDAVEEVGLVKIDLLGNRALALVDEGLRHINGALSPKQLLRLRQGQDDPETINMLQRGDTLGITQLESPAMRHLLIQNQTSGLEHVIQTLALVRPGVASIGMKETFLRRRQGLEEIPAQHPKLDKLLARSQGLMLYEDDALEVLKALLDVPISEAHRFYKRIVKYGAEEGTQLLDEFVNRCRQHQVPERLALDQWAQLHKFRHYTFCKSHATSYGLIAWIGAYIKQHYPLAFWVAVLNNAMGSYPRRVYIEAIKQVGIEVRLPCVNRSRAEFSLEENTIRVGLEVIATLPEEIRNRILIEREREGPFQNLEDFWRRVQPGPEALSTLVRCGALDCTGKNRPTLFLQAELLGVFQTRKRKKDSSTTELFPTNVARFSETWCPNDLTAEQRWRDEWSLLGFLLGPPLMSLFRKNLPNDLVTSRELRKYVGRTIRFAGVTATARNARTSDGRDMQFISLQDEYDLVEVNLFPGSCQLIAHLELGPYIAEGIVNDHLGVIAINAHKFTKSVML
ncbi:MAG: DNA polymerase III subunit alpha [Gemmataceae bacterium]